VKREDNNGNHASCVGEVLELHLETNHGNFTLLWEGCGKKAWEGSNPVYSHFRLSSRGVARHS
jgi:hypothetical protein